MSLENNPLKQYFRRPAIYMKLPSGGKMYDASVITIPPNGELAVYPMTAIDEITSKTPDALFNGSAMSDIIKSCIPDIKDPWAVNSIDLDAILVAIKAASGGNDLTLTSECPSCKEISDYGINLVAILGQLKAGDYDTELVINTDLTLKFRPLNYKEMNEAGMAQFESQRMFLSIAEESVEDIKQKKTQEALKFITDLTMRLLSKTIMYVRTPTSLVEDKNFILDFLKNCDRDTYVLIRDHNAKLKSQNEVKPMHIKCNDCGHEYDQQFTLNTSDFFG
jgi:hypothetical protein